MHNYQTSYLSELFHLPSFKRTVDETIEAINLLRAGIGIGGNKPLDFDTIAFSGTSGAGLAYILSYRLNIPLLMVRKPSDDSHSLLRIEGNLDAKKYLIIDDLIFSGNTAAFIVKSIYEFLPKARCTGLLLYNTSRTGELCFNWGPEFPDIPIYSTLSLSNTMGLYCKMSYSGHIENPLNLERSKS